jgi:hypothetical protein
MKSLHTYEVFGKRLSKFQHSCYLVSLRLHVGSRNICSFCLTVAIGVHAVAGVGGDRIEHCYCLAQEDIITPLRADVKCLLCYLTVQPRLCDTGC